MGIKEVSNNTSGNTTNFGPGSEIFNEPLLQPNISWKVFDRNRMDFYLAGFGGELTLNGMAGIRIQFVVLTLIYLSCHED